VGVWKTVWNDAELGHEFSDGYERVDPNVHIKALAVKVHV
jgi:hypothetical protein